jgi:hypothetical protein
MDLKKILLYSGLVLAGVVFADKIRALPLLSRIPTL